MKVTLIVASHFEQACLAARQLELPPPGRHDTETRTIFAGPSTPDRLDGLRFDRLVFARPVLAVGEQQHRLWDITAKAESIANRQQPVVKPEHVTT